MAASVILILAVLLDFWLGEPQTWHPLRGFGRLVLAVEQRCLQFKLSPFQQKLFGLCAWMLLVLPFATLTYFLQQSFWLNLVFSPIILYFCIAAKSLEQHGLTVFDALQQQNLSLARQKVAMIVSRDTSESDELTVRRAAIESLLENGADAIFAPLFWFMLFGVTGAVWYRLSNTLDAMWGYKNQRYLYFGWAAARIDDVLNWLPARLTGLSYAFLGQTRLALHCWITQAQGLESPNAGVVMTAGAGALNLQLGGAAYYHGMLKEKPLFGGSYLPNNNDIVRANCLVFKTLLLWLFFMLFFLLTVCE
jgi:adenosylcobinamide-phosphate synthase